MANKLTGVQTFELMQSIKTEYAESGLTDEAFAEKFSKEKFVVTFGNVQGARSQLGIESSVGRKSSAQRTAAEEVLARLEKIEKQVEALYRYFSGKEGRDL